MESVIKKNKMLTNVLPCVFFVLSYVFCIVVFFTNGIRTSMFDPEIKATILCIVSSFVFVILNLLLVGFGAWLKNKIMTALPAFYSVLLLLSFILLGFFNTANLGSEMIYNILSNILIVVLAPIFGVVWAIGPFALILFVTLVVSSIIVFVRIMIADRKQKKI